jgi:hypothetical protein
LIKDTQDCLLRGGDARVQLKGLQVYMAHRANEPRDGRNPDQQDAYATRRDSFGGSTPGSSVRKSMRGGRGNHAVGEGTALPNGPRNGPSSRRCHNGMV